MTIIVVPGTPVWPEHQRGQYVGSGVPPRVEEPPTWTVTFWSDQAPAPEAPLYGDACDYSHGWPLEWMRQSQRSFPIFPSGSAWPADFKDWLPLLVARDLSIVRVLNSNWSPETIRDLQQDFDQRGIDLEAYRGMNLDEFIEPDNSDVLPPIL